MSCPHRHESARFVDDRPKTAQSLVGTFPLDRADYHRRARGRGTVPRDETLGLSRPTSTPGAREPVSIAGAVDGFGEAANVVLREMSVLRPSGSTVERTSEAVGGDIGRRLADGETFAASTPWPWPEDAEGKTCAYASLDPTGPGMQGPDGASADGRMAATIQASRWRGCIGTSEAGVRAGRSEDGAESRHGPAPTMIADAGPGESGRRSIETTCPRGRGDRPR